jgi:hypothetical protein
MTRQRFIGMAAAAAALGAAAWISKVAVLAATDGDDSAVVGVLYVTGVLLMLAGSTWVGVKLAGDRPLPVVIALGALGPILFLITYGAILDPLGKSIAGSGWFEDEAGILLTGLVWLAASLPAWLATTTPSPRPSVRSTS